MLDESRRLLFSGCFRQYYRESGIAYPWRTPETSPFHLLLAEMLLRQTDAPKVSKIWPELTSIVSDPVALLALENGKLHEIVSPLGLAAQRVQALEQCCERLLARHKGRMPRDPYRLLALPHVGLYAVTAVTCFVYNRRNPVVDGNVLRVLGRLTGNDFGRDNRRSEDIWRFAWAILPKRGFRSHNYGLLDFAAQLCTARSPKCDQCPLRTKCAYFLSGRV